MLLTQRTTPRRSLSPEDQAQIDLQAQMIKALAALPPAQAIGVAASILLRASEKEPLMLRRVLLEPVVKEGFRGTSLWTVLRRVVR